MTRSNVLTKTLWDSRRGLLGWTVGLGLVSVLYAAFYPSMRQTGADMIENYPEALKEIFNFRDFTAAGYLGSTVYGILGPLLVIVFAISTGTRAIAGDEENGTLELLLAHPVSRVRLLLERSGALLVALLWLGLAQWVMLLAISRPAELDTVPAANLAAMGVHLIALGLAFGCLALAIGAVSGRRTPTVALTGAIAVATWLANAFAGQADGLLWLRRISPFHYAAGGEPLLNGLRFGDLGVLLAVSLLSIAVAAAAFDRRDIAV